MNDALYIAATGMQSQQLSVNTIANNMANVATPGFKRGRVNFQDLMVRDAAALAASADGTAATVGYGGGVSAGSAVKQFDAADVSPTGNPLDLAIRGDGFIEVQLPDGGTGYWRGGSLQVTPQGWLATAQGHVLAPQINVGRDGGTLSIDADGRVSSRDATGRSVEVGQIELHTFGNATGLQALGDNVYKPSAQSGEPIAVRPGENGAATLAQGSQEQSNVKLIDEMVSLMMAQRAYEMNVKVIQAADEMLGMSNNLRR
jgi:flagellar basal-body rod protein FlgG